MQGNPAPQRPFPPMPGRTNRAWSGPAMARLEQGRQDHTAPNASAWGPKGAAAAGARRAQQDLESRGVPLRKAECGPKTADAAGPVRNAVRARNGMPLGEAHAPAPLTWN